MYPQRRQLRKAAMLRRTEQVGRGIEKSRLVTTDYHADCLALAVCYHYLAHVFSDKFARLDRQSELEFSFTILI
jgi:hypothetical protein